MKKKLKNGPRLIKRFVPAMGYVSAQVVSELAHESKLMLFINV